MSLNSGDRIAGRYEVKRRIGEGGMSNIYLCQSLAPPGSPNAGQWVIKEMTVSYRDPSDQKGAVELFEREAELLKQLNHKNLPRVIDKFVVGNRYYTVMEFVDGEDLGKMLLRNPQGFAEAKVVAWGIEIATVLYYLHSQKPPIIFRDLKPSNIMISRGQVKLIDFGIARRFDPFKKKDTMRIGSPGYAPPEQYSGQTDRRSDIYALGVTLHQLVTGRDPAETQTPFKLPSARALKPTVSAGLEAIINQATELDPQRRFRTALEMKRALQALIGVQSGPLSPSPTARIPSMPVPTRFPRYAAPPAGASDAPGAALPPARSISPRLGPPAAPASPPGYSVAGQPSLPSNPYAPGGAPSADARAGPGRPFAPPTGSGGGTTASRSQSPGSAPPSQARPAGRVAAATTGAVSVPAPLSGSAHIGAGASGRRPRTSSARLSMFLLVVMAALLGYRFHDDILRYVKSFWFHERPPAPIATIAPTPPIPTVVPASPVWRALSLLDEGSAASVDEALDLADEVRHKDPSNGLALLAYNNGLVLAELNRTRGSSLTAGFAAPPPISVLQVVYSDDRLGTEWLRGVALAQRDINVRGGVQGHLIVLLPSPVVGERGGRLDVARYDPIVNTARDGKAVAALLFVPQDQVDSLSAAYVRTGHTPLPLMLCSPRRGEVDDWRQVRVWMGFSVGPVAEAMLGAMVNTATSDFKPRRVAIVATPSWSRYARESLETDLRKARSARHVGVPTPQQGQRLDAPTGRPRTGPGTSGSPQLTCRVWTTGGDEIADIVAMRPDLVIFLGDAWALDHFATVAGRAASGASSLAAPILCGWAPLTEGKLDGPLADWVKRGQLWSVSPYNPLGMEIVQRKFDLAYRRTYGLNAPAGVFAANGFEMLMAVLGALDDRGTEWTADGVRRVLLETSRTPYPSFSGIFVGPAQAHRQTWVLIHLGSGSPTVVRKVSM